MCGNWVSWQRSTRVMMAMCEVSASVKMVRYTNDLWTSSFFWLVKNDWYWYGLLVNVIFGNSPTREPLNDWYWYGLLVNMIFDNSPTREPFFCFLFWDLVLSKFRKVIFFISCFKICFKMFSYILRGARCYSWGTVCWFWFSSWCNCFCLSSFLYFVICLLSLLFCILHNCVMIHHCFESSFDDSSLMHHDIRCAV